jgi:CRISPR-associated protein Csa3
METLLISPITDTTNLVMSITKYSPDKVVLLTSNNESDEAKETKETLTEIFGRFIEFEFYQTHDSDLLQISQDVCDAISKQDNDSYRVVANLNTDIKVQILGFIFGLYNQAHFIDEIFYIDAETKEFINVPILKFGLSDTKKDLLLRIKNGEKTVQKLSKDLGISRGMTYNHIRELRDMGLIDRDILEITTAGNLAIV